MEVMIVGRSPILFAVVVASSWPVINTESVSIRPIVKLDAVWPVGGVGVLRASNKINPTSQVHVR